VEDSEEWTDHEKVLGKTTKKEGQSLLPQLLDGT